MKVEVLTIQEYINKFFKGVTKHWAVAIGTPIPTAALYKKGKHVYLKIDGEWQMWRRSNREAENEDKENDQ